MCTCAWRWHPRDAKQEVMTIAGRLTEQRRLAANAMHPQDVRPSGGTAAIGCWPEGAPQLDGLMQEATSCCRLTGFTAYGERTQRRRVLRTELETEPLAQAVLTGRYARQIPG
jgi:hypothetical protein